MNDNNKKQPGKILMPFFVCSQCGRENDMPKFPTRPDGNFTIVMNNERGANLNRRPKIDFVCVECHAIFSLGMKEYVEPKMYN